MIDKFMHGFLNRVYGFDDYTQLEINSKLIQKIDEVIDVCNNAFEFVEWLKEQGVPDEVQTIIDTMLEDGTLDDLINIEKLNQISSQLSNDIETTRKKLSYKEIQTNLLSNVLKRIRVVNEQITIDLQGDSIFYGYDVNSEDKRPASQELTDDRTAHQSYQTRASITIAESLQEGLNELYGIGKFLVKNKGYSGDTAITGFKHWYSTNVGDITILGYMINDSRGTANEPYKANVS